MATRLKPWQRDFIAALQSAWALLIEFPASFGDATNRERLMHDRAQLVMWCFPLLGVFCGIGLALWAHLCSLVFPPMGAMILFALSALALLELKDRGTALRLTASLAEQKSAGVSWHAAFSGLDTGWIRLHSPLATLVAGGMLLLKLAALGVLFHFGRTWFLTAVLVLNFTVQGALAMEHSLLNNTPLLPVKRSRRNQIWYLALLFLLFNACGAPLVTLLAGVGAFVGCRLLRLYWLESYDGVDANMITLAGGWAECWALFCALLLVW